MIQTTAPLRARLADKPLRVLIIGRISTEHQNAENIAASYRYVEDHLRRLYSGPLEIRHLGERASGMLADRATIREAEDLIATGEWDVVMAEDLSRIFRNPRHQYNFVQDAVDSGTRVICIGDNLDTADENWEIMLGAAALRHGTTIPDIRRRVRRTATHAFHNGGMVQKVKFGYRKLSREEAASGHFGPQGLRLAKLPEHSPIIREMAQRILQGESYNQIADWLHLDGIPPGQYSRAWSGRVVQQLLADPLLHGLRMFRRMRHEPVYRTGRHRRQPNPEPETRCYPELAHLSESEHQQVLAEMQRRHAEHRLSGRKNLRVGIPRSRALWPAQSIQCGVCGSLLYCYGAHLKCRNTRKHARPRCWNRVQVPMQLFRQRFVNWLAQQAERHDGLRECLQQVVRQELDVQRRNASARDRELEQKIRSLEQQAANLTRAISAGGSLQSLVQELRVVEQQLEATRIQQTKRQRNTSKHQPGLECFNLNEQILYLLDKSYAFGDWMRTIVRSAIVRPVQALDRPQVRPQAIIQLSCDDAAPVIIELDLFDPPLHIRHLERCRDAVAREPSMSLKQLSVALGLLQMTIKRALDYHRLMRALDLTTPYRVLSECPEQASRWKLR